MDKTVKQDILSVLSNAIQIIQSKDTFRLKELSNHTIHNASIYQDEDSVSIAVIIYSLSKTLERGSKLQEARELLEAAWKSLERDDLVAYRAENTKILDLVMKADTRLSLYIDEVIRQAQIKKGTKLYEHGISLGQAASVLDVSQWELMGYVGKTRSEEPKPGDVKTKLTLARGLFE